MAEAARITAAWDALATHRQATDGESLRDLFAADPARFETFSARLEDLLLDYSKTAIDARTLELLADLARACEVEAKRDAMLSGAKINTTEDRAVLHTALRNRANTPVFVDGKDVMPDVNAVLAALGAFADGIRDRFDRPGARRAFHRCRQYRHRRLGPRPRHGDPRAGALS